MNKKPKRFTALMVAVIMAFSSIAVMPMNIFGDETSPGETLFITEWLGNGHIIVDSQVPREQEVMVGSRVDVIDLTVSVADTSDEVLLLRYEILHNGNIIAGNNFPMEIIPQLPVPDLLPELIPTTDIEEYPCELECFVEPDGETAAEPNDNESIEAAPVYTVANTFGEYSITHIIEYAQPEDAGKYSVIIHYILNDIEHTLHAGTFVLVVMEIPVNLPQVDITDSFADHNFLAAVLDILGKEAGEPVYLSDVAEISVLDVSDRGIETLAGIEHFTSLEALIAGDNQLTKLDVSPLAALIWLDIRGNEINDPADVIGWQEIGLELGVNFMLAETPPATTPPPVEISPLSSIFVYDHNDLRDALMSNVANRVIELRSDINLGNWMPINIAEGATAMGTFTLEGNGHILTMTAETTDFAGLFGRIDSAGTITIRNLGIYATGRGIRAISPGTPIEVWAGGVAGRVSNGTMTIENSFVVGSTILAQRNSVSSTATTFVGGLIGEVRDATVTIRNSYVNVTNITANSVRSNSGDVTAFAGGFIGREWNGSIRIENSYATGGVAANASRGSTSGAINRSVGGLLGQGTATAINSVSALNSIVPTSTNAIIANVTPIQLRNNPPLVWDWDAVWTISEGINANLPVLRVFNQSAPTQPGTGQFIPVSTAEQLREALTHSGFNRRIVLQNNIDLGDWTPIHISDASIGTFLLDGNGHILTLSAERNQEFAGLFGDVRSRGHITIRNLGLYATGTGIRATSPDTPATLWAGGIAGRVYQGSMTIENSFVVGSSILAQRASVSLEAWTCAGGFIGEARNATVTIRNSYVNVTSITANSVRSNSGDVTAFAGGFIGREWIGDIRFENSYAAGVVAANASRGSTSGAVNRFAGGLLGQGVATITNSIRANIVHGTTINNLGTNFAPVHLLRSPANEPLAEWDWSAVWTFSEGVNANLPVLRVFNQSAPTQPGTGQFIPVSTAEQLREAITHSGFNRRIVLQNNIDLGNWTPIHLSEANIGTFLLDGNGHILTLSAERNGQFAGLLGDVRSRGHITIRNLGLYATGTGIRATSPDTPATLWAGGIAGRVYQGSMTIENSFVVGSSILAQRASVSLEATTYAGGFIGEARNAVVTIRNSYVNVSNITANSVRSNSGDITAFAGGFIGREWFGDIRFENSYATGAVNANASRGSTSGAINRSAGGLLGEGVAEVTNSVRAQQFAVTGTTINNLGTSLTPVQLRSPANAPFSVWDWSNVWMFEEGVNANLPVLRIFYPMSIITAGPTITVSNPAQLFNALTQGEANRTIRLQNDIDLGFWQPIHITDASVGSFILDGNGHTLTFSAIQDGSFAGLFGDINSRGHIIIRNLGINIAEAGIRATSPGTPSVLWAGGIAGRVYQGSMTIENSFVVGSAILAQRASVSLDAWTFAGGFIGEARNAVVTIRNSYVNVTSITANSVRSNSGDITAFAGGFIGREWIGDIRFENSYATGAVAANASRGSTSGTIGRFAGGLLGQGAATVTNSARANAVVGATFNNLGTLLTTEQLRNRNVAPLSAWNWDTVWTFTAGVNDDFPVLRPPAPITVTLNLTPSSVEINNTNTVATSTVGGNATGAITHNANVALPAGVSVAVNQATGVITVTGIPPAAGQNAIVGTFTVMVTRQGQNAPLTVNVNLQPQAVTPQLAINQATWTPTATGQSTVVAVTSNVAWTAVSNATAWLTVTPNSGSDNGNITLTVTANTGTVSRSGTITVAGSGITRTITVTQAAGATGVVFGDVTGTGSVAIFDAIVIARYLIGHDVSGSMVNYGAAKVTCVSIRTGVIRPLDATAIALYMAGQMPGGLPWSLGCCS